MNNQNRKTLLVGDNPFHNISHLSQDRARGRVALAYPGNAAKLIVTSFENGANGFMFSVSETTLSILRAVRERGEIQRLGLYAIVPYAYEYVKLATQVGGIMGLAKKLSKDILLSRNISAITMGLKGVARTDPISLMKAYLLYEINRIRYSVGKRANLHSLVLHEVITDMALALNLDWFFKSYADYILNLGLTPGFNTCNFPWLVNKFKDWNLDLRDIIVVAPFNQAGFLMNPSKMDCEKALESIPGSILIAVSILAAGYLQPLVAIDYIANLPNIKGVAVGVSKESHARETFRLLKEKLDG